MRVRAVASRMTVRLCYTDEETRIHPAMRARGPDPANTISECCEMNIDESIVEKCLGRYVSKIMSTSQCCSPSR